MAPHPLKTWYSWALLLSLVAVWGLYFANQGQSNVLSELFAARRPQQIINGFVPNLELLTRRRDGAGVSSREVAAMLVFATDDTCPYCNGEIDNWKRVIDSVAWSANVGLTVVTLGGDKLSGQLAAHVGQRAGSLTVLEPLEPLRFPIESGISSVPMTLVLDREGAVRARVRRLDDTSINGLVSVVANLSSSRITRETGDRK
jgi:hypothetical protein